VLTVVVLPSDRCVGSDHGAEAAPVVPGFDLVTDRDAGLSAGRECGSVDEFFLQRGEERFRWGAAPTHPGAADRLGDAVAVAEVSVFA
jgi:hypothetical protein